MIGREKDLVLDCLETNWISSNGRYIKLFEDRFAEYIGFDHAVSCSNGTTALHLALLALDISVGDEVIVPTLTFVATANAVAYTGAAPVFVDSEPDTWNLDPGKIENSITPKTKAIVVVHLYGHPCDMDDILKIARKHKLHVVEDAAEAIGSAYKGRMCGSIGDISTFSFYGNKTITTGEGGMVLVNNDRLAGRVRILKGQGMNPDRRYWFDTLGYNYRMTNVQAAIGYGQMEKIDLLVEKRRLVASWYNSLLESVPGVTLPVEKSYARSSYWMYSILIEEEFGMTRDRLMRFLYRKGIETRPFFYPMHTMPVYRDCDAKHLSTAVAVAEKGINLPTYYDLRRGQVEYITDCIKKARDEKGFDP